MSNSASHLSARVLTPVRITLHLLVLFLFLAAPFAHGAADRPPLSAGEIQKLGEKMYREGLLPSGEPIKAYVSGDVEVSGTAFTCVSCHLRSGLGSLEGDVSTPPTNGRILYQPREPYIKGYEFVPSFHNYAVDFPVRPAYTDKTLADLIASGVDPTGRSVLKVMPRYEIDDDDMAILIAYLKTLADEPSPGVSEEGIKFATVVVAGTDQKKIDSMLTPLEFGINRKNSLATAVEANDRIARMGYNMLGPDLMKKRFSLKVWTLRGPAAGWRAQLEEYYKAEPVFALLSGITNGDWAPVHRFCEDNKIPDILPIVDYPVLSDNDWYTLYFSRGVRQEGEAAARYLHGIADLFAGRRIVQVIRDTDKSRDLAAGFRQAWSDTGHEPAIDVMVGGDEPLTVQGLVRINSEQKPAALVVWDSGSALDAVAGLAKETETPGLVILSGTYFDQAIWTIPEELRDLLYFTYPYRLPQEDARYDTMIRRVLSGKAIGDFDQEVVRQAYITNELLGETLKQMRGEYYRDFFLDTIDMMPDAYYPLYERLSFGPGQRYTSKGCFIVQLNKGEKPQLERRSEWVTR
jgi:hypothetical protein